MKLNLNTILLILGGLGVFTPDVAAVATWLASTHIAWMGTVVRGLGLLAAFCSAAPLVVPRLRAFLALLGLATPPGARAPWNPMRDVLPEDKAKGLKTSGGPGATAVVLILGSLLFAGQARAQEPTPSSTCPPLAICIGKWTIQPATAVAYQINLKTGDHAQGAVLAGGNVMTDQFGIPLGAGILCGAGFSSSTPGTSKQCNIFLDVSEWGALGIGAEQFTGSKGASVYQTIFSFAGTITSGGTASQTKALKASAIEAKAATEAAKSPPPTPKPVPLAIETTLVSRVPAPVKTAPVVEELPPEIAAKAGLGALDGTSSTPAR